MSSSSPRTQDSFPSEGTSKGPSESAGGRAGDDDGAFTLWGVRFPLLSQDQALRVLSERLRQRATTAVCFPDMSTMNIVADRPAFRDLLARRFLTLNDGAGLALAARLRGTAFPANLNGTDLCPLLFDVAPPGTSVYVLGAAPGVAGRAAAVLAARFPHLGFVGSHHGYLDAAGEAAVIDELRRLRPHLVLVGMGNPLQIEFIDRHVDDPQLEGVMWLAVGGQLDYYGGALQRAPRWVRSLRLEWLHLVRRQPHKLRRYLFGIPRFVTRAVWTEARRRLAPHP